MSKNRDLVRVCRARGLLKATAAAATLSLVLSACGGSDVSASPDGTGGPAQAEQLDGQGAETQSAPAGASTVPAGATSGQADAAVPATGITVDSPATADVEPGKAGKGTDTGKARDGGKTGAVAATGPAAAAQRLVQSSPLFGGKGTCKPATLSEIRVGNLSTLSGVLGELFAPVVPALQTFVASQNACGGLNGHRIKMFFEDDQGDPSTAVAKAQKLIEKDRILAFVGNIQVLTVHAIIPTVKKSGIPIIGGDLTSDAFFENPLVFPQGPSVQSFGAGYLAGVRDHFKKKIVGNLWCIEVPRSCSAINTALHELAPQFGVEIGSAPQVSITQPSFVQQCLEMKNARVEAVILSVDAASAVRLARSCQQVGYFPETLIHPVGIGNEKQFFGNKWLGGTYVPLNTFPHMADKTPAQQYYQASVRRFNPGFDTGGAASSGWTAGALLVAASANLPAENPTTQNLLDTLYEFKGQDFTKMGGLTSAPLMFERGGIPRIPYCHFHAVTNEANNGWSGYTSTPVCTKLLAPSDPQSRR